MGSQDLNNFALNLVSSYSLPLLNRANRLICYRQPVPTVACDPLTDVLGAITSDASGLHPTLAQCYQLLQVEWSL